MGCFSRVKIDDCKNIQDGKGFCFLIPKEFGGGYIRETYQGYGKVGEHDWYELLAVWNTPEKCNFSEDQFCAMKKRDELTKKNRNIGIGIGCYNKDHAKLKYPLRLVSYNAKSKVYEDYAGLFSIDDKNQGWSPITYQKEEMKIEKYL